MKSTYDPERVRAVVCPTCGAGAGESCRTQKDVRRKHDYHATRKGVVYAEFATPRRGLVVDADRKAAKIVQALDDYLTKRESSTLHTADYYAARQELLEAIKDIIK